MSGAPSEPDGPSAEAACWRSLAARAGTRGGVPIWVTDGAKGSAARFVPGPLAEWSASASLGGADPARIVEAIRDSSSPHVVVGRADELAPVAAYAARAAIARGAGGLKLIALPDPGVDGIGQDLAQYLGLPSFAVAVPSDAAQVDAAVAAALARDGPVYVRVPSTSPPISGDRPFAFGVAALVRDGSDLTLAAAGPPLALAIEVASSLGEIGISARVLDLASAKPLDARALRRAAHETGAILTFEEQNVWSGIGAAVAALVAETDPVPVRRLGLPDVPDPTVDARSPLPRAAALARAMDEAWELLRARGKVQ